MVSNESVVTSRFIQQTMRKKVDSEKAVGESAALIKSAWDWRGLDQSAKWNYWHKLGVIFG